MSGDELRDPPGFGRIAYAYHLMALDCGASMMPCTLLEEHGRTHFLTRRFDRKGRWQLTPAYDMTFAFNPNSMWLRQQQMSVRGKRLEIARDDLRAVAKQMNIRKPDEIIDDVKTGVKKWRTFAKKAEVRTKQAEAIGRLLLTRI